MAEFYDPYMRAKMEDGTGMVWKSVDDTPFVLEGFYWRKPGGEFRRMPHCPLPPGVEAHAPQTAGGQLRFKTDSAKIMLRAAVRTRDNDADIMTYGRIGFDIYCGAPGVARYAGVTHINFDTVRSFAAEYCTTLFDAPAGRRRMREFTVNFPLYAQVDRLEIGFEPGAEFAAPSPRVCERPIVWYGTSITQGCCASRPGMAATNIVSRLLNRPVLNFGFAGSGKGEPEVAEKLAEIESPAMFLLDYDANTSEEELAATLPGFIGSLRKRHPGTPVVTISRLPFPADFPFDPEDSFEENTRRRREIHRNNLFRLREAGDRNIHFIDGCSLYGEDFSECSSDNCHSSDLGFYRTAHALAPELRRILEA